LCEIKNSLKSHKNKLKKYLSKKVSGGAKKNKKKTFEQEEAQAAFATLSSEKMK
ncbi:hypothetical protein DOY81_002208, partial [Sarcophaga bullata]